VHPSVLHAIQEWEQDKKEQAQYISKGENPWTEHYSAFMAEVPDPQDQDSQFNQELLDRLLQAEQVWICGEASSHCVKASVEHLVSRWPQEQLGRLTLLIDAMSPVAGCEGIAQEF